MIDVKVTLAEAEEKMEEAVMYLDEALAHIRAGKANVKILDGIRVDSYGSLVPLNNVASVNTPDARTIAIKPWDKSMFRIIEKATEEDIASMRAKLREMDDLIAAKDYESLSPVTRAFHRQMTNICGQNRILRVIEGQDEFITRFSSMAIRQEDRLLEAHAEHYALVDFVEKRDLAGFQDLMERHINRSKEMCLAALAEQRKHQNF